jgi:hypothetical protein
MRGIALSYAKPALGARLLNPNSQMNLSTRLIDLC